MDTECLEIKKQRKKILETIQELYNTNVNNIDKVISRGINLSNNLYKLKLLESQYYEKCYK